MSENSIIETRVLTLKSWFDRNKLMYYCNHALYMDLYITAIGYCISGTIPHIFEVQNWSGPFIIVQEEIKQLIT